MLLKDVESHFNPSGRDGGRDKPTTQEMRSISNYEEIQKHDLEAWVA